jgi:hypothetical protein
MASSAVLRQQPIEKQVKINLSTPVENDVRNSTPAIVA